MFYILKEERIKIYEVIMKYYWEFFNKEVIEIKNWMNCGELCLVVCKKYVNGYYIEYELREVNGLFSGVIIFCVSDISVLVVDVMGFDVIEFGGIVVWVFEFVYCGIFKFEEVGFSDVLDFMKEVFFERFVEVSEKNVKFVVELVYCVVFVENEIVKIFGFGKRKVSVIFDEKFKDRLKYGESFKDYVVFIFFGEDGEMMLMMYWVIGNYILFLI